MKNQKILIVVIVGVIITLGIIATVHYFPRHSTSHIESLNTNQPENENLPQEALPTPDADIQDAPLDYKGTVVKIIHTAQIDALLSSKEPAVVKFHADFCGGCKMAKTPYANIAKKLAGKVTFYEVDAQNEDIMTAASQITDEAIQGIPAFVCLLNGKAQEMITGFGNEKSLEENIKTTLKL